ncbi:glycosyltransferase family 39 protein [Anabaena subtropica]|uniref:Glycosyltransferase family 39 protein n=1 Tax=Anabaena subtropica FACHB-260 TaxID=2692884 RepID=A0ABR8CUN3_9NOST|nr:glycosyltransferase family 39 protein [Anabaena subtropica]MBD2346684.1 glycosyltransferase family 39 protein [Anabaena subtropica FACHB-260]
MNSGLPVTKLNKLVSLETLALAAIAIAILLRIVNLGSREFWYDEVLSLLLATGEKSAYQTPGDVPIALAQYTPLFSIPIESGFGAVIATVKKLLLNLLRGEPHPPLFYLSQHFWLRLFGNSETAMRSLNTLFSIGAIASAYSLGKVVIGHRGGLLLAAFLGINPFYLFHSLNVRMYAPLVLWTTLSATALLHLIDQPTNSTANHNRRYQLLWNILLIGAIAAGLLTFYFYLYWVIALGVLILYLDRQHWWQHGLRLAAGILLTIPWVLWGAIKQIRSADLKRFGALKDAGSAILAHLQDISQTLASNLVLGDWVTSLPTITIVIVGCLAIAFIIASSLQLWQQGEQKKLAVALILGLLPLLIALGLDIVTKKTTLNFGGGRTMIIVIPGCLLLLTLWLEKAISSQWRTLVASVFLLLYLTIGISDFSLRQRSIFHSVAELITQQSEQPTLIAMNSKAWGHVLRLAYYTPSKAPIMLLAEHPADLANSLEKVLTNEPQKYPRVLWLESENPVWSKLKTPADIEREEQKIQQILSKQFQLTQTQNLMGTMNLDNFTVKIYNLSANS